MTTPDLRALVDPGYLGELLGVTWASFVDPDFTLESLDPMAAPDPAVVAQVHIVGSMNVRVRLTVDPVGAVVATGLMLGEGAYCDPTDADVTDAMGELANILGGNIKALLPDGARLHLPTVDLRLPAPRGHESHDSHDVVTYAGWGEHLITASVSVPEVTA